jgi:hypothetical protein
VSGDLLLVRPGAKIAVNGVVEEVAVVCSTLPSTADVTCEEAAKVLFVGDDWAEDHHDVEILSSSGKRLGRARLPEGMAGMTRLHELIAEHLDEGDLDPETGMLVPGRVVVGIETDRGRGWPR